MHSWQGSLPVGALFGVFLFCCCIIRLLFLIVDEFFVLFSSMGYRVSVYLSVLFFFLARCGLHRSDTPSPRRQQFYDHDDMWNVTLEVRIGYV
jgi:hypothetical protein